VRLSTVAGNGDCRRKVRLSQKTARQRRQSHFSATVWTGFNSYYLLRDKAITVIVHKMCWRLRVLVVVRTIDVVTEVLVLLVDNSGEENDELDNIVDDVDEGVESLSTELD